VKGQVSEHDMKLTFANFVHSLNKDTNGLKITYISRASLRSCLNLNLSVASEDLNPKHV
jgi:hypothetical protein